MKDTMPYVSDAQRKQHFLPVKKDGRYSQGCFCRDDYMTLCSDIWQPMRKARMVKDGFKCSICGTTEHLVVHHINYPNAWGEEDIDNDLVTLCWDCHNEKVHQYATPEGDDPR